MDRKLALLFDRNAAFTRRLQRILRELGCDAKAVPSRKALIQSVRNDGPAIAFISVELPRKAGFSVFSDVRQAARQLPIILMTGSVLPEEMRIHQTLRVHADAYLDKRAMDTRALLSTLNRILRLELDEKGLDGLARRCRLFPRGSQGSSGDSLEAEIDQKISWEDGDAEGALDDGDGDDEAYDDEFIQRPDPARAPVPGGSGSGPERAAGDGDLQEEVEHLRRELEEMRCAVRSTPFSEEYRSLKSRVVKAEEEARSLRDQMAGHAQRVHDLEAKLVDAEFQVRSLTDSEAMAQDQVRSLEKQIAEAVQERVSAEHEWARSVEQLKARFEREKAQISESAAIQARQEIEAFQKQQSEAIESVTGRTQHEVAEAVKATEERWQARLAQEEKEHGKAVEALRSEHQAEISRIISEQARKILDKENELKAALTRADTSLEEELAARDAQWKERLDKAREEYESGRSADCAALEARYRKELQVLRSQHMKERERLQKMHTEGLESLSAKLRTDYRDPGTIKNPLLRSKVEEKLREREAELAAHAAESPGKD